MVIALCRTLAAAGKSTDVLTNPDGSRLLLLRYGARALGLFPRHSNENLYWTSPALSQARSAQKLFASDGWHNTGGDRTWLAPELDIFFAAYPGTVEYRQPPQLEMSDYDLQWRCGGVEMAKRMTLHLSRTGRDVELTLTKWFGAAANPLRYETDPPPVDVAYAGYTQRTRLQLASQTPLDGCLPVPAAPSNSGGGHQNAPTMVGIWNLLQLPPGGDLLVPTYSRATPQICFGNIPAESLICEDRLLRLKVCFPDSHKIAVRATATCGRAGYVYPQGNRWSLVVRNFFVNPSGEYVDVQQAEPDDMGYSLQICRVDNDFGDFVELEYHTPATGSPPDPVCSEDVSQVWAFRGAREAIDTIARKLLGTGI